MVVKSVLEDADAKQGNLTNQIELWIDELKHAVYDADDLLDEVATFVESKHHKLLQSADLDVSEKVRLFFLTRFQDMKFARKMTKKVQQVNAELSAIANNHNKFGFKINPEPIRNRREETCSYTREHVIGRDDDKKRIINMLLDDSNDKPDVSFLSIVGVGGLGKTTLAQYVFHDERVTREFGLRLWACVSDHDQQTLDVEAVLLKILESAMGQKYGNLTKDEVHRRLQEKLSQNKYLLILDDLWNEKRHQWRDLEGFLKRGPRGSRIIVTTRSRKTGRIVGNGSVYELKGLSDEDSWHQFERIAFEEKHGQANPQDLVEIGQKIVKKCANVPLPIRVIGSLLYGQDKDKWLSIQQTELAKLDGGKDIMSILKFSYHHLDSPLKSCFSYCALFPKDHALDKDMLIRLWIAQGFVVPTGESSLEDVAEEYFLILIRRCFFQQGEYDRYNQNNCYKIHDLMHDVAQEVARNEIRFANCVMSNTNEKIRHIYSSKALWPNDKIRTCLQFECENQLLLSSFLKKCTALRALSLQSSYGSHFKCLPNAFEKLVHLRYLDLSGDNKFLETLPKSITKLYNLQTFILNDTHDLKEMPQDFSKLVKLRVLDLSFCSGLKELPKDFGKLVELRFLNLSICDKLKELPKDFGKLVNLKILYLTVCRGLKELPKDFGKLVELRVLDLSGCYGLQELPKDLGKLVELRVLYLSDCNRLTHMPLGISKLSYLHTCPWFPLGEANMSPSQCVVDQLGELKALTNLKGHLEIKIRIPKNAVYVKKNDNEGEYLRALQHLNVIELMFSGDGEGEMISRSNYEDALVEDLEPHPNLTKLVIRGFQGMRMPKWISISLSELHNNLRVLELTDLPNVEYIQVEKINESSVMFPSIELLVLGSMPKLKGWWRSGGVSISSSSTTTTTTTTVGDCNTSSLPSFPRLSKLYIFECPELTYMPFCPNLEELDMKCFNERLALQIIKTDGQREEVTTRDDNDDESLKSKLKVVRIDNIKWLISALPTEAFGCLELMKIDSDQKVECLREVGDQIFRGCTSSLRTLEIWDCSQLRSLIGLEHLTALQKLSIEIAPNLSLSNSSSGDEEDKLPWQSLHRSLLHVTLLQLPKMVNLPKGMQFLTSLQTLGIRFCDALESLPDWMPKLISLKSLWISSCKALNSLPECMSELTSLNRLTLSNCSDSQMKRWEGPNGEDWPHIQHIPDVYIS